jgi:hypothetical protein
MNEDYSNKLYAEYSAQRVKLDDASLEAAGRYERAVLTISSGALALSVTFIDKIASDPQAWTLIFLVLGWVLLLAAVIFQLLALSASHEATREQIKILDLQYSYYFSADDPAQAVRNGWEEPTNKFNSRVNNFNIFAQVALITGVVCVLTFSALNIVYKKGEHHEQEQRPSISQSNSKDTEDSLQGELHPANRQAASTTAKEK